MSSRNFISDVNTTGINSNAFSRNVTIEEPDESYDNAERLPTSTLKVQLIAYINYIIPYKIYII